MKCVKRLLFFLAISVLIIGIASTASAGSKNKACGKIRPVSGHWTYYFSPDKHEIIVDEEEYGRLPNLPGGPDRYDDSLGYVL
jgi:hypothetical protein